MIVRRVGKVELLLTCSMQHTWKIGMHSRKAKNGCRQCKDHLRAENARRQFEEQARLQEIQEQRQRQLLQQQALSRAHELDQTHVRNSRIRDLLVGQLGDSRVQIDAQLHRDIAELFLSTEEQVMIDFFHSMEDSSIRQLVNRLRLALHPDKNTFHPRAGEAFARMTIIT